MIYYEHMLFSFYLQSELNWPLYNTCIFNHCKLSLSCFSNLVGGQIDYKSNFASITICTLIKLFTKY